MKRTETTVESLKALGYNPMLQITGHFTGQRTIENEIPSGNMDYATLFESVVRAAQEGREVEIRRNLVRRHVTATTREYDNEQSGIYYFLRRPMTAAEISEEEAKLTEDGITIMVGRR